MIANRSEKAYQMIKLIKSGRTLAEAKAMMKAVSVGLHSDFSKLQDIKDLQDLEGGMYRIRQTRKQRQGLLKVKFSPRKYEAGKEEVLAKWAMGYKGRVPLNWKRDGNLIRKGPPNKPRPNTARNVIKTTKVIGAKKVLKDFKALTSTLQDLLRRYPDSNTQGLQKAFKAIRTKISTKG